MKRLLLFVLIIMGFCGRFASDAKRCPVAQVVVEPVEPLLVRPVQDDMQCRLWVDSVLDRLSLKERVGQLFIYTIAPHQDKSNRELLRKVIEDYKVGGLLFSGGLMQNQVVLTNEAQRMADIPLLITFDGEWGLSMRLRDTPAFPKNMVLGCIQNDSLLYEYGCEMARQCKELGVQVNFAPVADVNINPKNPVINTRSFGEDPVNVANKVIAYARGLEDGGVLSVAKHFPGHGDTDVDSHKALPVLTFTRERLDSVELYPFKKVIEEGLGGIMVGHLEVPAFEKEPGLPSSLSRKVVYDLLMRELKFRGLVFTDALAMKGVSNNGSLCLKALKAGHDLLLVPRRKIFYKGKELEEMDLDTIIRIHPEIVIVDELAHTNVEGSRNEKRWQDVMDLLDEGINVISAVNIQHIESINEEVQGISGIEVKERIPDSVLEEADEVVNIDLTAEELITRLKAGKIYRPDKVALALNNFFKTENILQLRELALKEVALRVEKKVENEVVVSSVGVRHEKFMACISSHEKTPRRIIRKAARLATRYNTSFVALYVQTPRESADRITLANQRHLLNHFKLVTELGGEVMQVQSKDVLGSIVTACREKQITTVCMGSPSFALPQSLFMVLKYRKFVNELAQANIDLIILA